MEHTRIEARPLTRSVPTAKRLPLLAGPMIWYALAGLSIFVSLGIFLYADPTDQVRRFAIAIFIGLWAPMFGILGIRAELMEMREDLMKGRRER